MFACMYVCMYVCVFACMYVCLHVCMYVCVYVCMHVCLVGCDHFQKWSQHMSCRLARHHSQMLTFTMVWRVTIPKCLHLLCIGVSRIKNANIYCGLARYDFKTFTYTAPWRGTTPKRLHVVVGRDTTPKHLRFLSVCYDTTCCVYISFVLH